jgi:hypothetical protein
VFTVRVDVVSPLSIKLVIAAGSINCPFTKNVKLFTDVVGNEEGAGRNPFGNIAIFGMVIDVANTCLFVFKYVSVKGSIVFPPPPDV